MANTQRPADRLSTILAFGVASLSAASAILGFLWRSNAAQAQDLESQVEKLRAEAQAAEAAHEAAVNAHTDELQTYRQSQAVSEQQLLQKCEDLAMQTKDLQSKLAFETDEKALALERAQHYEQKVNLMLDKENQNALSTGVTRYLKPSRRSRNQMETSPLKSEKGYQVKLPTSNLLESSCSPVGTGLGAMTSPGGMSCYTPEDASSSDFDGEANGIGWTP
eukprot:TRINITY_DN13140_c0_g1_i2.p1 TRINITY_DN13140_c0_g1~~TRINITY_DN13140_c0_g1_i2.p1  ORF type:complete len:221 (+),score=51.80 TRINITY_DN13140_c0_g1_i2:164-826(+)